MNAHSFCRSLLALKMKDIRKLTTPGERKKAWAWKSDMLGYSPHLEFHGPGGFYWHGQGCCLYYAKSSGWEAWENDIRHRITGGQTHETIRTRRILYGSYSYWNDRTRSGCAVNSD